MDTATPLSRQVLDEDLQIIRVTLATIADDIRLVSPKAAEAVQTALSQLDQARQAFNRPSPLKLRTSHKPARRKRLPPH